MKSLLCILIALAILISGCSHTYHINPKSSDDNLMEMNQTLHGKQATLFLKDEREIVGENIQVGSDSTNWNEPDKEESKSVPTSEIEQIIYNNRERGALQGLYVCYLLFIPPSAIFGAYAIGFAFCFNGHCTGGEGILGAIAGAACGVAAGVIVGKPIGYAIGIKETYIFTAEKDSL